MDSKMVVPILKCFVVLALGFHGFNQGFSSQPDERQLSLSLQADSNVIRKGHSVFVTLSVQNLTILATNYPAIRESRASRAAGLCETRELQCPLFEAPGVSEDFRAQSLAQPCCTATQSSSAESSSPSVFM